MSEGLKRARAAARVTRTKPAKSELVEKIIRALSKVCFDAINGNEVLFLGDAKATIHRVVREHESRKK